MADSQKKPIWLEQPDCPAFLNATNKEYRVHEFRLVKARSGDRIYYCIHCLLEIKQGFK
jgi:hypothetical protein